MWSQNMCDTVNLTTNYLDIIPDLLSLWWLAVGLI